MADNETTNKVTGPGLSFEELLVRDELRAIAILIQNHQEEFDGLRKGIPVAIDFNDAVDKTKRVN